MRKKKYLRESKVTLKFLKGGTYIFEEMGCDRKVEKSPFSLTLLGHIRASKESQLELIYFSEARPPLSMPVSVSHSYLAGDGRKMFLRPPPHPV